MGVFNAIRKRFDDTTLLPRWAKRPVEIAIVLFHDYVRCDLLKQASAMAYVTLLSLIPSLVAIFVVLSIFSPLLGPQGNLIEQAREFILSNLASGAGDTVVQYLDKMLSGLDLATIGWSSFASVLVTLILLLSQIEEALNRIWLVRKARNNFRRFMYFWTFMTLGVLVIGIAIGVSSKGILGKVIDMTTTVATDVAHTAQDGGIGGSIAAWCGAFLFFLFLYKVVPNCNVRVKNAAIGAAISALLLHQGGRFYGMFAANAANYQTLYGALAQLPLFLMWLYICWIIILLGSLVSWRLQEGFPEAQEADSLDSPGSPREHLRNAQLRAMMPLVALIAIFQRFQQGTGKGMNAQDLAHELKLPITWVCDGLDVLEQLGYVIQTKFEEGSDVQGDVVDPYFPAFPADSIAMEKLLNDLGAPINEWLANWEAEMQNDLPKLVSYVRSMKPDGTRGLTLAQALKQT
jgi:membrane protein